MQIKNKNFLFTLVMFLILFLSAGCYSVFSADPVIQIGTDSSGQVWFGFNMTAQPMIKSSNGKTYNFNNSELQQAVDDLEPPNYGEIYLPPGEIDINNPINISTSQVKIIGAGDNRYWGSNNGSTILSVNNSDCAINISGTALQNTRDVVIKNIKFKKTGASTGMAIRLNYTTCPTIEKCGFGGIDNHAIFVHHKIISLTIAECGFQSCGDTNVATIEFDNIYGNDQATDLIIRECVFEADAYRSIFATGSISAGSIVNCYFEQANGNPEFFIFGKLAYVDIDNNFFIDGTHVTIGVSVSYPHNHITNNVFHECQVGIITNRHTVISNNNFKECNRGVMSEQYFNIINDNIFASSVSGNSSILLNSCYGCEVSDNLMYSCNNTAINLTDSHNNSIDGNTIYDESNVMDYGIRLDATSVNNTIANNVLKDVTNSISDAGGYGNVFSLNIIDNVLCNITDDLSDNTTDDLPQGSTNLYSTLANIRSAVLGQWLNLNNLTVNNADLTSTNISNWNTAFGWGDHSTQNYFDKDTDTIDDAGNGTWGVIATNYNKTQWESGGTPYTAGDGINVSGGNVISFNQSIIKVNDGNITLKPDGGQINVSGDISSTATGNILGFSQVQAENVYPSGDDDLEMYLTSVAASNRLIKFMSRNSANSAYLTRLTIDHITDEANITLDNAFLVHDSVTSEPLFPSFGMVYANDTDDNFYFYDGSSFVDLTAGSGTVDGYLFNGTIQTSEGGSYPFTNAGLQDALNSLNNTGGTVFIPSGNLTISTPIIWYADGDGITLEGAGNGVFEDISTPENYSTVLYATGSNSEGILQIKGTQSPWNRVIRPTIRNLAIQGKRSQYNVGINITHSNFPLLENVGIHSINGTGLWVTSSWGLRVDRCDIWYCGSNQYQRSAVWLDAHPDVHWCTHPTFTNSYFESCYYKMISNDYTVTNVSRRGIVDNCYFEVGSTIPGSCEYGIEPGRIWTISNNNFLGQMNHSFIFCNDTDTFGTKIVGNVFTNGAYANASAYDAQVTVENGGNIIISDNFFSASERNAIMSEGYGAVICDNIIYNAWDYGILCSYWESDISGNYISELDPDDDGDGTGIYLANSAHNSSVCDNTIKNCEMGINLGGNPVDCYVAGNTFISITDTPAVLMGSGTGCTFIGLTDDALANQNYSIDPAGGGVNMSDNHLVMSNGGNEWHMYVNATGVLVWEIKT